MSTRINHNILSMTAQRNIWMSQNSLDTAVNRLSSGLRVNYAWDDAGGIAVSERFRAQISSMEEAERNANYNINLLATAEGALSVIDEKLIRLRALAIQASNGALTSNDRASINQEYVQLRSEINRIALTTNYNGLYLLDGSLSGTQAGSSIKFHIGTFNNMNEDYYFVSMGNATTAALGIADTNVLNTTTAQSSIELIDAAIESKDSMRTNFGAYVNRLQNTILNLQISRENATRAESVIRDADIAAEMSDFVRAQILMQSGISMLAQANMVPQMVSQLIG
ncbi:flagellin [bacterium]|nr:flagellin [bacterium]